MSTSLKQFRTTPIVRRKNTFTGLLDGDDTGYRDVPLSPLDAEDPDPLVITSLPTVPINFRGRTTGICWAYPGGIPGAPEKMVLRLPAELALREANKILELYGKGIIVIDAFRDKETQAKLWGSDRRDVIFAHGLHDRKLSILEEIRVGRLADNSTSYSNVVRDRRFERVVGRIMTKRLSQVEAALEVLVGETGKPVTTLAIAEEVAIYWANIIGKTNIALDEAATTAHGNGGATDLWLFDKRTGRLANFGAPYGYVDLPGEAVSPTVMDYFEFVTLEEYRETVARNPVLLWYLKYHGVNDVADVTQEVFDEAQANRRLLYHALMAVGASYFSLAKTVGEFWHFNFNNLRGGKQTMVQGLDGSGNGCHAILNGKPMAAWTNAVGHQLARIILAR